MLDSFFRKDSDFLFFPLPEIQMLKKLMNRKQKGKKPYSEEFCFDEKMKFILQFEEEILSQIRSKERKYNAQGLRRLSLIALQAKEETKMESLKKDFDYLSTSFLDCTLFYEREAEA